MVSQKKITQAENYQKIVSEFPNFLVVGFKKTTHQNLERLRKELRKNNSYFKVIKNTIFEKAINKLVTKNSTFKQIKKNFFPLKDASAIISIKNEDYSIPLKTFYNFLKADNNFYFKFALLENAVYDADKTEEIAKLPSKNQLIGKIALAMKMPVVRINLVIKYNFLRFINILKNKSTQS